MKSKFVPSSPTEAARKSTGSALRRTVSDATRGTEIERPAPEMLRVKARLVNAIADIMKASRINQTAAAERMGMSQPDVSKMLRGEFRPISLEKLMSCLVALHRPVTISIDPAVTTRSKARITVVDRVR